MVIRSLAALNTPPQTKEGKTWKEKAEVLKEASEHRKKKRK